MTLIEAFDIPLFLKRKKNIYVYVIDGHVFRHDARSERDAPLKAKQRTWLTTAVNAWNLYYHA